MAVSSSVFSSFIVTQSAAFVKSTPVAVKLASNKLTLRTVAVAAASKQATEAEAKKREPRGIMKPRRVSPEMQAFLGGVDEIARTKALKEIWAYIKEKDLQVYGLGRNHYLFCFRTAVCLSASRLVFVCRCGSYDIDFNRVEPFLE